MKHDDDDHAKDEDAPVDLPEDPASDLLEDDEDEDGDIDLPAESDFEERDF